MKPLLSFLLFLSFTASSQKVRVNEYDKFIKQRRIELDPVTIFSSERAKVSLSFNSIASTFYVFLSGFGWGASTIDVNQEVIFLFSNDSTITVKSTGLQICEVGNAYGTYKHRYYINLPAIEALSKYELTGIRKYDFKDYSDMEVPKESAARIKQLSSLFIEELKKAKILHTLKQIDEADVSNYVGDSVQFCSKIFSAKNFDSSENKPLLLNVNQGTSARPLNLIIAVQDRKNFGGPPEVMYNRKDVCISGIVQLQNSIPQIIIHGREQITVKSPIRLDEVSMFVGDSVTVAGKVVAGEYFSGLQTAPTLLSMGSPYPDQLLTVVIENKDRKSFTAVPEKYYVDKIVNVAGRVTLNNGKPQIIISNKDQLAVVSDASIAQTESLTSSAAYAAKVSKVETNIMNRAAEFPGGAQGFVNFLRDNLKSPTELEPGKKVTVIVRFSVAPDGTASNFEIIKSAGSVFNKEVIRVLKTMPKWIPKLQNGRPVEEIFMQPVTFRYVDNNSQSSEVKSF